MGTTVEKLNKVLETKEAIRTSINNKGGTLTESDTFSSYSTAIDNIQTGSKNEPIIITENGTYTAPEGTGYSPVNVNVALEGNPMQEYVNNNGGDGKPGCFYLFYNYQGTSLDSILKSLDFSKVTNMSSMFNSCSSLTTIPLFNTSNVTNMNYMFRSCSNLTSIPLLDTSNVTNMSSMFYECYRLTSIPQLNTSNVTNMSSIFYSCYNLNEIHMAGMKVDFNISSSTNFTESALVEILNNLATVTSTTTLTMGSTNLAKLTDEEKAIATNKGWTLA